MEKLYETLLQLPLFQGITLYDFNNLVGKLKWHFDKFKPKDTIVLAGDPCDKVVCILSGEVECTTQSPNDIFTLTEYSSEPFIIEPYSMFGINNAYKSTYKATSEVTIGSFTKLSFLTIVNDFIICRLNIINLLCCRAQNIHLKLWEDNLKNDFVSKIIRFILLHCENTEGKKMIKVKLYDLADLIGISHVSISVTLNKMEKEGLIKLSRMYIQIPDMSLLKKKYESID